MCSGGSIGPSIIISIVSIVLVEYGVGLSATARQEGFTCTQPYYFPDG